MNWDYADRDRAITEAIRYRDELHESEAAKAELVDALENLVATVEEAMNVNCWKDGESVCLRTNAIREAETALAKAKGE